MNVTLLCMHVPRKKGHSPMCCTPMCCSLFSVLVTVRMHEICMHAGQAIVQMAQHRSSRMEYAIKFFIVGSAFVQERALYVGESPITRFLPQV